MAYNFIKLLLLLRSMNFIYCKLYATEPVITSPFKTKVFSSSLASCYTRANKNSNVGAKKVRLQYLE